VLDTQSLFLEVLDAFYYGDLSLYVAHLMGEEKNEFTVW
jgi:hypothetical protein